MPTIAAQTSLIKQQSDAIENDLRESQGGTGDNRQALVWFCLSLGHNWRSVVASISAADDFDFRRERAALLDQARISLKSCRRVIEFVADAEVDGKPDLQLVEHEMQNVVAWIDEWPETDAARHEQVRKEIEAGESRPAEEVVAEW